MNDDGASLYDNPFGWNQVGDVLFIDQPVGVGFSYTSNPQSYAHDENQVAIHLTNALQQFYLRYPETKTQPLYLFAESYGGKYIPAFASEIVARNRHANDAEKIPLQGIGLGNALVDPIIQRYVQTNQAYYANIIGQDQVKILQDFQTKCISQIQQGLYNDGYCDVVYQYIAMTSGNINGYDVRTFDPSYNRPAVLKYLNRRDVQEAIHITSQHQNTTWKFDSCNDFVYELLQDEILTSYKQTIKDLYTAAVRMLFYAGNFDLKDGPVGVDAYLQTLGYANFNSSPRTLWIVNGSVAGYHKTDGNLIDFVVVHGAGHYVPTNQPAHSLDMVNRFINKIAYCDPVRDVFSMPSPSNKEETLLTLSCNVVESVCENLFRNCSFHGHCGNDGKCVCDAGFVGADCSTSLTSIKENQVLSSLSQTQHSWKYFQLDSVTSEEEVYSVSISYRLTTPQNDIPVLPPQENLIGEGIAGSIQPFNKVCVYGKKNGLPSWTSFDFVICASQTTKLNQILSITTPTAESQTSWTLGVFNSKLSSLQLDISYKKASTETTVPSMWQFWVAIVVVGIGFAIISLAIIFGVVIYFRKQKHRQYVPM